MGYERPVLGRLRRCTYNQSDSRPDKPAVSVKMNWRDAGVCVTLYPSRDYRIRRTPMSSQISKEQLKQALSGDLERLLDDVVEAVNQAKPGHIIDDSEDPVRDAA